MNELYSSNGQTTLRDDAIDRRDKQILCPGPTLRVQWMEQQLTEGDIPLGLKLYAIPVEGGDQKSSEECVYSVTHTHVAMADTCSHGRHM